MRAAEAGTDEGISRNVSNRGEIVDPETADVDGGRRIGGDEDRRERITYVDFDTRLRGEEVSDYTEKFNSNQDVTNTTVYLYEADR